MRVIPLPELCISAEGAVPVPDILLVEEHEIRSDLHAALSIVLE
jgi:hypothetical protein